MLCRRCIWCLRGDRIRRFFFRCRVEARQHVRIRSKHMEGVEGGIVQHRRIGSVSSEGFVPLGFLSGIQGLR